MSEDANGVPTPTQGVPDVSTLVAQEVARILASQGIQAPAPSRELTSAEQVDAALEAAHHQMARDNTVNDGARPRLHAVLAAVEALWAHVQKQSDKQSSANNDAISSSSSQG